MSGFGVERMTPQDERAAAVTLARAFHDDPLFNFLVPDLVSQAHAALGFMQSAIVDARPFHEVWIARVGAKIAGVAVWLPPGAYPRGPRREAVGVLRDLRSIGRLGRRLPSCVRLQAAVQRAHAQLKDPHWYLALLAADPLFQRAGIGTALLVPVLDRCDTEESIAYLETQKADNVPWYHRSGFQVTEQLDVSACPPMWTMRRDPR
ncbi:MAG: GNAT family N-acetyltransferase [Acidimicrobiia bacterium]